MIKKNECPVIEADVVIVGGGVGGFIAAVASARTGAKTLVIEKEGYFGGTANTGLVGTIWSLRFGDRQVVKGIPGEFVERLVAAGGAPGFTKFTVAPLMPEYKTEFVTVPYNSEVYKIVADEMVMESGAEILFHTVVTDVVTEEGSIKGVYINNANGRSLVKAKVFADCTGDALIAHRAGCESLPWETDELQPMTICFKMANVDCGKYDSMPESYSREMAAKGMEEGFLPRFNFNGHKTGAPGEMVFNVVRVPGLDGTKAEDLTTGELLGRQQVKKIVEFFKANMWGLENAYISAMAPSVGVRETRRIRGKQILDDKKVLEGYVPADSVALGTGPCDAHRRGSGFSFMQMPKDAFGIPYDCMIPTGVDNLLVSGRNISATRAANATMRHMGTCMALGHAAGTAAALCVLSGCLPGELPVEKLQAALVEQGAEIK